MGEKLIINEARCKSCGLCIDVCAKVALFAGEKLNNAGYRCISVDDEKCIKCGMCYMVCPDYVFTIEEVRD